MQDSVNIGVDLYETIFIFSNFNDDLEEESDLDLDRDMDSSDQLGEAVFSRVSHQTRSRNTRPPQRLVDG